MGLDMYVEVTKEPIESPVDFEIEEKTELCYWRKHPNLHGWMAQLYWKKGGKGYGGEFYGPVQLLAEDLDAVEKAIRAKELPHTEGFFFGESWGDEDEVEGDLEFVEKARKALADDFNVYYDSSW